MIRASDYWICSHGVRLSKAQRCDHPMPKRGVAIVLNRTMVYYFGSMFRARQFFAALRKPMYAAIDVFEIRKGVVRFAK
jgi:hypothetical protein